MFNSRAATRAGHARRRSLNWRGGVCCHHCRGGASDEPPSSPLQSPPPLKPPHQRRRAYPGIAPRLRACVRRRRCLRWRRRRRRRRQQQRRRRGVGGSSRGRPRSRPRSRHGDIVRDRAGARASAARGRRATCRHEVNVFLFRIFRRHHRARAQDNFRLYLSVASSGFVQVRLRFGVRVRVPEKTARARAPPPAMLEIKNE